MTTEKLAQTLQDSTPRPLILDARSEAEYAVSHLNQAEQVPDLDLEECWRRISEDTPIVVYCSVGYRSAKVAQKLEQAGFQRVFNLEGGIFQWVNEDRPIVSGGQPTKLVHPYSETWGKLLKDSTP